MEKIILRHFPAHELEWAARLARNHADSAHEFKTTGIVWRREDGAVAATHSTKAGSVVVSFQSGGKSS